MSTAVPLSRSRDDPACARTRSSPTSTPRVGWRRDEQPQRAGQLAGQHDLLLVAAGERAGGRVDRRRADVELRDALLGVLARRWPGCSADARANGGLVVQVEDEVLGDGEVGDQRRRRCGPRARSRRRRRGTSSTRAADELLRRRAGSSRRPRSLQARGSPRPARSARCPARRRWRGSRRARTSKVDAVDHGGAAAASTTVRSADLEGRPRPGSAGALSTPRLDRRGRP